LRTISQVFEDTVDRSPSKEWLTYEDQTYTYEQAHGSIGRAAGALAELGVERGTRVMATTRNSPEYLFTWFAVTHLGAILTTVNPKSTGEELAGLIAQVRPRVVVSDPGLKDVAKTAASRAAADTSVVMVDELLGSRHDPPESAARPDDVAVMIPTSGTTGRSKLVMQTHRAYVMAGEGFPYWLELTESDRLMTSLPLFHINAPSYSVMGSVAAGAGLILLPRFSGRRFIEWSRRYGATEFNAIGAMIEILMRQPERPDDAENPLRLCYTGPSPPKERQLAIESRFGFRIVCGYALSESPYGLIWPHGTRPFGTLGAPRQHPTMGRINEARVLLPGGTLARPGEVGELQLKNPAVMAGYYDMPEETRGVISDGWLSTGDLVEVNDDGTYTFVGREKEIIRRRGENLSPLEVEGALEAHPLVSEAAVIGVPSELTEEEVKAFVVPISGATIGLAALRDFVAERVAAFKVPRYLEVVDELPHTPTGRIAKHELPSDRTPEEHDFDPQLTRKGELS
jgi:crotonobetaine/carnitine-CoA ligase